MKRDLVGQKFGSLKVVRDLGVVKSHRKWLCVCDCGNEVTSPTQDLVRTDGKAKKSCYGCRNRKTWQPVFEGDVCKVPLTNGGYALIDADDYPKVKHLSWNAASNGYIRHANFKKKSDYLHKMVMGASEEDYVDHINHDLKDNRKENLRICTQSQNSMNRIETHGNTGIRGVHYVKSNGKYQASIMVAGRPMYLGQYLTIDEAAEVRKQAEIKYHGRFRPK